MSEEEYEIEALGVEVSCQPIELYKVLKIANAVSGGGEAKMAITEGYVAVNGDVETRKRCKIYDGDVIQFNGEFYLVLCDAPVDETPRVKSVSASKTHQTTGHIAQEDPPQGKTSNKKPAASQTNAKGRSTKGKSKAVPKPAQIDEHTGRREIKF